MSITLIDGQQGGHHLWDHWVTGISERRDAHIGWVSVRMCLRCGITQERTNGHGDEWRDVPGSIVGDSCLDLEPLDPLAPGFALPLPTGEEGMLWTVKREKFGRGDSG